MSFEALPEAGAQERPYYTTIQGLFEPYYTKGATDFIVRLLLAVWIKYSLQVELLAALSVYFQD